MQLLDQKSRSSREEFEPILYVALVDSQCQNFWPVLFGSFCAAIAAVLTELKTGNVLLWPCAVAIIAIGTVRAFQMRQHELRKSALTYEQAKAREPRYNAVALAFAAALGIWCF